MKSKAPLLLMEQMVMLLVFALAAAICLRSFVLSDRLSRRGEARDRGVTLAQTAAETIRHQGGTPEAALEQAALSLGGRYEGGTLTLAEGEGDEAVLLTARGKESDLPGLSKAVLLVEWEGETVFELTVAWQEVAA